MKAITFPVLLLAFASFCTISCQNKTNNKGNAQKNDYDLSVDIDTSSQTIKLGNTLFSLPSPYQLTMILKNANVSFNEGLLNPISNNQNYSTTYKKCVNLGVYGADLAYENVFEQSALVVSSFSVVKVLAADLGLTATLTKDLIDRIEQNVDNKDSLLYIMSNTYRDIDVFLKESQRQKEGTFVLAGGWVEAMYMLTQLASETKNDMLNQRVAESRQPLENLIKILSPYYDDNKEVASLIDKLIDLTNDFEGIEQQYTYCEPEIDVESKMTIVKSTTKVNVTESDLFSITNKIKSIRTFIIE